MEKQKLPNATTSLVLGIFSVLTCICYGIIGLPLGIVALILGNKALRVYNENPEEYDGEGNAKAGKILGIIGIILNIIYMAMVVFILYKIGFEVLQDPELLQERLNELTGN